MKKIFELSEKKSKNGRRKFKIVLHTIFSDDVLVDGLGTEYQDNGITWIEKYCEDALSTIKGMSLRAEFLDENRTQLCGHGESDIKDDLPIFENAVVLGEFDGGYIDNIDIDGEFVRCCIGTGTIDEMCYKNFIDQLEKDLESNSPPFASVEIYKTENNDSIKYLNNHSGDAKGRVPIEFIYSGCALLGITPADKNSKLLELNNKKQEEQIKMDKEQLELINNNIQQTKNELLESIKTLSETNAKKEETIEELNACIQKKDMELNELNEQVSNLTEALGKVEKERQEAYDKIDILYKEEEILKKQIADVEVKNKIGELNSALSKFTDEEKEFAKEEIKAFEEDPTKFEINTITNKILQEIGKKAKEDFEKAKTIAEQNSLKNIDIFAGLDEPKVKEPIENFDDIF